MKDYIWKPHGIPIRVQGIPLEPILAFKQFVMPGIRDVDWIEDSSKVTDTGMSKREWLGLILHALALMDLTGDKSLVAKMFENDDGGLVRVCDNGAVYIEQTLATHMDKRYNSVHDALAGQIKDKSSRGQNYADNRHLLVFCNMDGVFEENKISVEVSKGCFNIVNILAFSSSRQYLSLIFDREKSDGPIHKYVISETELIKSAMNLDELPIEKV